MLTTSDVPKPAIVLSTNASTTTPPSALYSASLPSHAFSEKCPKRVVAIDLRIGLNLLGEQGRKLLAEYITIKRQQ